MRSVIFLSFLVLIRYLIVLIFSYYVIRYSGRGCSRFVGRCLSFTATGGHVRVGQGRRTPRSLGEVVVVHVKSRGGSILLLHGV